MALAGTRLAKREAGVQERHMTAGGLCCSQLGHSRPHAGVTSLCYTLSCPPEGNKLQRVQLSGVSTGPP